MKRLRARARPLHNPLVALADLPRTEDLHGLQLQAGDVHIWLYRHDQKDISELEDAHYGLLSPDEKARYAQFGLPQRRGQYLSNRALCRWALSQYAQVPPTDWRFQLGPRGKPSIAAPIVSPSIWFSLSHVDNLSVCVVSRISEFMGVDVETIDPARPHFEIAESVFPKVEVDVLRGLGPDRLAEDFVCRWALKESLVKASEIALGLGLAGATFDLGDPSRIGVSFAEDLNERSANWRFELLRLCEAQILGLAVRADKRTPLRLRTINCIPGQGVLSLPAEFAASRCGLGGPSWGPGGREPRIASPTGVGDGRPHRRGG